MIKQKLFVIPVLMVFLSAGCSLFGGSTATAGIVKTVNGGSDWQFTNSLKDSKDKAVINSSITKLAFDPQNREVVYAGSFSGGVYKSENSGSSWTNILSKISVYDLLVNPGDGKIIFAAGIYAGQGLVLKTTDGGASWQQVYNESSKDNPVRTISFSPTAPNQIIIGTDSGNLIKSSDSGLSWQLVNNFKDPINGLYWRQDGIYVLLKNKGLYKGQQTGADYVQLSADLTKSSLYDFGTANLAFNQAYVDIYSTSLIYLATSRGLYKSSTGGSSWQLIGLPVEQDTANARTVQVAPTSSNIVFTAVGKVIYKSTDGGNSWQTQNIATTGYIDTILVDPSLPQIVYAGVFVPQN